MKSSAILVQPTMPLQDMLPNERSAISRFLFGVMRGLDDAQDKRWRRLWARVMDGEILQLYPIVDRHAGFHAMHMALETRLFAHQDGFVGLKAFRLWLKTGACFGKYEACPAGGLTFVPSSLSYEDCSDDEMREFHQDALEFLRTPHALATLWPSMTPNARIETLELLLRKPEEDA